MWEDMSDLVVVGGGPAGLTAAIYARRAGLRVRLLEAQGAHGGQMATTPEIENYPGVERADGFALGETMARQATSLGAVLETAAVTALQLEKGNLAVKTADKVYLTKALVLAMGARRKALDIPGEAAFLGRGVSYCAVCDGNFFRGKAVTVVGGGETALEDALYLAGLGSAVTLIHRRDAFRAAKRTTEIVAANQNIERITPYIPVEILGDKTVTALRLRHAATGELRDIPTTGVFVCVGTAANSELLGDALPLDNAGRVTAGESCTTNIPGVFVAGDLRQKPLYQVVTAAADGAVAATQAIRFLEEV